MLTFFKIGYNRYILYRLHVTVSYKINSVCMCSLHKIFSNANITDFILLEILKETDTQLYLYQLTRKWANMQSQHSRAYYVGGRKQTASTWSQGRNSPPPNRPCTNFFWLEIWPFHVANWLWPYYVEHDVLLYIKTPILELRNLFFYPFLVKIMLKMHQNLFGDRFCIDSPKVR